MSVPNLTCASWTDINRLASWNFVIFQLVDLTTGFITIIFSMFAIIVTLKKSIFENSTKVLLFLNIFYAVVYQITYGMEAVSIAYKHFFKLDKPCEIMQLESDCAPYMKTLLTCTSGMIYCQTGLILERGFATFLEQHNTKKSLIIGVLLALLVVLCSFITGPLIYWDDPLSGALLACFVFPKQSSMRSTVYFFVVTVVTLFNFGTSLWLSKFNQKLEYRIRFKLCARFHKREVIESTATIYPLSPSLTERQNEVHLEVLKQHGITSGFQATSQNDAINNELIHSLLMLKLPHHEILRLTKSVLGLDANIDRPVLERFRRRVIQIEKEYKIERRNKDKFLEFKKETAFDLAFFAVNPTEKCSENFPRKNPSDHEITGDGSGASNLSEFRDMKPQTEPFPSVDLSWPENIPDFEKKKHARCISQYDELRGKYKKLQQTVDTLKHWKKYNKNLISSSRLSRISLRKANILNKNLTKDLEKNKGELVAVKRELEGKDVALQQALWNIVDKSVIVELKEGTSYSNKTWETVINLKSLGVSDERVGDVMRAVGLLAGVEFKSVPSASTCRNYALSALNLSKRHVTSILSDVVDNGEFLCFASDETTKGTVKLQAFGVHKSDGSFTCLGIEPVPEKSAQTALNALESTISQLPAAPPNFFQEFLVSVRSTMSDSAQTEKKLNKLIELARSKAVPEVVKNYAKLSKEEQAEFTHFSQFFCQLHVIANFTSVALKTLLEHELIVSKVKKLNEPTVFELIKIVSQLFGERGSGLHGILPLWTAWCKKFAVICFTFPSFIGNRFNILFVLASRIFFHRHHLIEFIEECDSFKTDLKKIRELLKNEMIIEHLRVLGLFDQLVTGPLWRISEGCEHILDSCQYALQLQVWLEECSLFPVCFFDGTSPTPSLEVDSPTNSSLLLQALARDDPSEMGAEVATLVCKSALDYFNIAFAFFLPGGKYCDDVETLKEKTGFAPATNRNIESVFGLMSHYFDAKPNMRIDVRVAFTLLKKNNTLIWLQKLPVDEQESILNESRAALKQLRNTANSRQIAIETVILRQMKEKNQLAAKKEAKEVKDRCKLTSAILSLGFWQTSREIKRGLSKLSSEKQKIEALTAQLKFRKFVIKQSATSSSFTVSANAKPLSTDELVKKLEDLIGVQQYARQLLLNEDERVGKKFANSSSGKDGFVIDFRIYQGKTSCSVQYEGESKPVKIDFDSFQKQVDDGIITFY